MTPNTYRQADNPNYWQNKAPTGYWQQDVHYNIKANIDETKDIIDASESLTYWNNSPDDLSFVYFHLYQNGLHLNHIVQNFIIKTIKNQYTDAMKRKG